MIINRLLTKRLPASQDSRRLVVLTGARQVGKTTLAQTLWGKDLRYLNLDSPGERRRMDTVPAEAWSKLVGPAILDEVQKSPEVFEKLKWSYDAKQLDFSVLLGSSRILLLDQIRESLAGRVFIYELWPLTLAELTAYYGEHSLAGPLLITLFSEGDRFDSVLADRASGIVGPAAGAAQAAAEHILTWGGLPTLLNYRAEERLEWLEAYQTTYLERDLSDLARLRDLDAFTTCHRLAAMRAGRILSYSELARDAGIPTTTVRRYLRYLELSYQTLTLPAWSGNPSVRLVKSPKLLWVDLGIQRVLSGQLQGITGEQYETAVAAQIIIALKTAGIRAEVSYLRTGGGLEIDLIIETQHHLFAFEFKRRAAVDRRDASAIERARRLFGERFRGGIVVYRGDKVQQLTEAVFAVPDWLLLGGI